MKKTNDIEKLLAIIPDLVCIGSEDGYFKYLNPEWEKVTGYSMEELFSRPIFDFIHPDDHENTLREINKQLEGFKILNFENRYLCKDGSSKIFEWRATPAEGGRLFAVARDITERKKAEEELRESEALFKAVFNNAGIGISISDKDMNLSMVNNRMAEMFGVSKDELIEESFEGLIPPEDLAPGRERLKSFFEGEKDLYRIEKRYNRKDGSILWVDLSISPIKDKDGNNVASIGMMADITDRKQSEEALRDSEERYRMMFDHAGVGILVVDAETGRNIAFNREAYEMLGYTRNEFAGHRFSTLESARQPQEILDHFKSIIEKGSDIFERNFVARNGEIRSFLVSSVPIKISGRYAIQSICVDITDRKALENQLQQASKMESIGTLAGGIAHDFNNLLAPIMLNTEMVMEDLPPDDPLQHNMKEIYQASERARNLVKQILTIARKRSEKRIPLKSSPIVKDALNFLRSTIPSTIDIRYNTNAEKDTVLADPTQLNQIVMNLCTNAAHAMREKGGSLEVTLDNKIIRPEEINDLAALKPGKYLRIAVRDTGTGIPTDVMGRIFEPYFTTKATGEGTGLGLAIIHSIIKNYGGAIKFESKAGRGTVFYVYLPLTETEISGDDKINSEMPKGTERILLVDDEKSVADITHKILGRLGYKVTSRTSSIEALEVFSNNPEAFDLVITDMTMPDMTGETLAREIMAINPEIPVILCTGFSDKIDEATAKEIGISAFVLKPIIMSEIANTIRKVL